jgi:AcrR family transcriptional regulator
VPRAAPARLAPSRFERRRRKNRAALLEAALELFQERGVRATRLEEICERADVAPRTFFNHFETREHLYQALAEQRVGQMAVLLDALANDPRPLAERLAELFARIGEYLAARPPYRELVAEMLHVRLDGKSETVRRGALGQALLRFVKRGVARGEIARRHRPEVLADLLLGALTTALANWSAGEAYDLPRELARSARALLDLFTLPEPT